MSWPDVKKINSDLNTPLNEGGVKIVKSKQIVTASEISASDMYSKCYAHPLVGMTSGGNMIWVATGNSGLQTIFDDCIDDIILSPIDKSKSIIISELNTFYENRDFDNGILKRQCNYSVGNAYNGGYWYALNGVSSEKLTVIEFY